MNIRKLFSIAYRNLVRNRRRTVLTSLAVGLGLAITMAMSSLIAGMLNTGLDDNIRMSTGDLQVRNPEYEENEASLLSSDLLQSGETMAAQIETVEEIQSAAPVLWINGLLSTPQESLGIEIVGIDPADDFHTPIANGIVSGEYLQPGDRRSVLVGKNLANEMDITVGRRISLTINTAGGQGQEGIFTVVGLVDTGFPSIDQHRVILPLAQAQNFSGVGDRVSSIIITLHDRDDTAAVAAQLQETGLQVKTWEELNSLLLESMQAGLVFYYIFYGIIFLLVAVLIANTLLMSVFEREREIGILASLGMKQNQIMSLILIEGIVQAVLGIVIGLVLGLGMVFYLTFVGFSMSAEVSAMIEGMAFGTTLYGGIEPLDYVILSLLLLVIVSLVSIYPAWFAARMEPVDALQAL